MTDDSYDYDANCRRWPDAAGPYPVGTIDFEVTDPIRASQYAPEPVVTRRLYVRAWYPAPRLAVRLEHVDAIPLAVVRRQAPAAEQSRPEVPMARIINSRSVLAVRDLAVSTRFYTEVLGFQRDFGDGSDGWSFLSRDGFRVMLGECRDATPAGELGDHSWFVHLIVDGVEELHAEVARRGAEIISPPATKPWGLREFVLRTPDGHRIVCGEPVAAAS